MTALPVLYSFRRCPYAMRARMALWISGTVCALREVKLANKPTAMIAASPKGTVPVLVLPDGTVLDESLAILSDLNFRLSDRAQLLGERRSMTDIALLPFVRQFASTDRLWFDVQPIPYVQDWLENHLASPLFAAVMGKYAPWAAGDEAGLFGA